MRNWLLFLIVIIGASAAFAQRISGELRLQITDSTGAGLHAAGSIAGELTGVNRSFETDEQGKFVLRGLPPGKYGLTIRSEGFAEKLVQLEIVSELPLDQRVTLDVRPLSTTIEVKDETVLESVETTQYVPKQALEDRESAAANRSVIGLVNTQPGWILEANGAL